VTAVDIAPLTLKLVEKAANELGYEVNNSDGAKIHTQVIDIKDITALLLMYNYINVYPYCYLTIIMPPLILILIPTL